MMNANTPRPPLGCSRSVDSNQQGPHEQLLSCVDKHRAHAFQKPIADFNQAAFNLAAQLYQAHGGPLILDSCCGVGVSTRLLAEQHPDHLVLGLDRSAARLDKKLGPLPPNAHLIRTDLADFWRLAATAGWQPEQHYLLYPNPYPKSKDLKLRWHGHPVFPSLLALGGRLISRSNWLIYLQEMEIALTHCGFAPRLTELPPQPQPLTAFERKYQLSGQTLWQIECRLDASPAAPSTQ